MLGKLIKHEFRQSGKTLVPMFAALAALVATTSLLLLSGGHIDAPAGASALPLQRVLNFTTQLLMMISIMALVAFVIAVCILCVMRFYKNLMGDEGYLMFTLPVTSAQLIASKLVAAVCWTLGAIAVTILSVLSFVSAETHGTIWNGLGEAWQHYAELGLGVQAFLMPWLLLLMLIVGVASTYLMLYLCIAIGSQWLQSRLVASIVAYIALSTALQVLAAVSMTVLGLAFGERINAWGANWVHSMLIAESAGAVDVLANHVIGAVNLVWLVLTGLAAVGCVIYFFATRYLLTKRLNLA